MSQCSTMNDTLQGFTIGPNIMPTALKVQFESDELLRDIIDAIAAAKQTPMLTKDDSVRVAIAVTKLQDVIYSLLDVLVAKKPVFDKAILGIGSASFLVSADLKSLKDATDGFGNEVVLRLANPIQQVAPLIISDLDFHFIRAIQVYSA
ncbi:hypothetical protein ETB97_012263 [Aspergillus alliaceus]|uniref:Uncharacterized protein n=1 Tax=Petromyces alliaceus TaxID=209559 RepID=A0A8H5ZS97_PETAA|nr:hypothetical protein ETB97_012263 [Aspergillus burnettii]